MNLTLLMVTLIPFLAAWLVLDNLTGSENESEVGETK